VISADPPRWETATDAEEVHALLCACDAYQASPRAPAPQRSKETTRRRVADGAVHLLRGDGELLAMFTLMWSTPFDEPDGVFPPARKPAYMSRLAVNPTLLAQGTVLGGQCYRRALDLAAAGGADVLRVEANPDLEHVLELLRILGFEQHGPTLSDGTRHRAFLQKPLGST